MFSLIGLFNNMNRISIIIRFYIDNKILILQKMPYHTPSPAGCLVVI